LIELLILTVPLAVVVPVVAILIASISQIGEQKALPCLVVKVVVGSSGFADKKVSSVASVGSLITVIQNAERSPNEQEQSQKFQTNHFAMARMKELLKFAVEAQLLL
jgi:siroheme synthase (precorrin-2 oxidase/ferrochelatase)